jgi:hypothetical protein
MTCPSAFSQSRMGLGPKLILLLLHTRLHASVTLLQDKGSKCHHPHLPGQGMEAREVEYQCRANKRGRCQVAYVCNPSCFGGWDWEDHSSRPAQAKWVLSLHLQNNHSKVDWRSGSSGRALALQVLRPDSNPSPTKKKKKKRGRIWLQGSESTALGDTSLSD